MLLPILAHILFYWDCYTRPFNYARGELLHTFFPSFCYLGDSLHEGRFDGLNLYDPYYWNRYTVHPVLSTFYPPHLLLAYVTKTWGVDLRFKALLTLTNLHALFGTIGWYLLFGPIGIVMSFIPFVLRFQPCIVYTASWVPWFLGAHNAYWMGTCLGMIILSGYFPIGIQAVLLTPQIGWHPSTLGGILMGTLIGLPQLIPFLRQLQNTKLAEKSSGNLGKYPLGRFISWLIPSYSHFNGVGFWEGSFYLGLLPIVACRFSNAFFLGLVVILMLGLIRIPFMRIPSRWGYSMAVVIVSGVKLPEILVLLVLWELYLHNKQTMIPRPYIETSRKPSLAYHHYDGRVEGLPYPDISGHLSRTFTQGYKGCMEDKVNHFITTHAYRRRKLVPQENRL